MKFLLTISTVLISLITFGQADVKFDIFMKAIDSDPNYTKVIDFDKPDTCYIHVITNDTNAIRIMKNTYLLNSFDVKGGQYTFYFPKKSSARIMTNLYGGKVPFKVEKVIVD